MIQFVLYEIATLVALTLFISALMVIAILFN